MTTRLTEKPSKEMVETPMQKLAQEFCAAFPKAQMKDRIYWRMKDGEFLPTILVSDILAEFGERVARLQRIRDARIAQSCYTDCCDCGTRIAAAITEEP